MFPEIWDEFDRIAKRVVATREATPAGTAVLFLETGRQRLRETYVDWAYVPIPDSQGRVEGFYNFVFPHTNHVVQARRNKFIANLSRSLSKNTSDIFTPAVEVLEGLPEDLPFGVCHGLL